MINQTQENLFLSILESYTGRKDKIICSRPLSGGDINKALLIETTEGVWFAKLNKADSFPGMFEAEAKGLELLRSTGEVVLPVLIGNGDLENVSMLVLEYLEPGREKKNFWSHFGQAMAKLHQHSNDYFGLDHHNYIGCLPQNNHPHEAWIEFFILHRLEAQIKISLDKGIIDSSNIKQFDKLFLRLQEFFPQEKPSLLHGDFWSGNYMINHEGNAYIIDPAVYYGHRLMDIAMSKLFGGFAPEFYDAYHQEYPLESNWTQAIEIANLYPLMVHVNLFGGGYLASVQSILKKF